MNNWRGEGDPDGNIIGDAELVQKLTADLCN